MSPTSQIQPRWALVATMLGALAASGSVATAQASKVKAEASNDSFEVTIVNDCPRALDARFVVIEPATKADVAKARISAAPVVPLPARSRVRRAMVANEHLVVRRPSGDMEAWFDGKKDGRGGTIRLGATCESISTTGGKN
jgi:hypothetical protein